LPLHVNVKPLFLQAELSRGTWQPHSEALHVEPIVALGQRLRPCYGPRGLVKSLLFRFPHGFSSSPVTSPDTLSVLTHMALEDPSALTLASAASTQAREHGDGAGMVLLLAASLLTQAKDLLTLGVTGAEIQGGYRQACGRALALLEGMACGALKDPREELDVRAILGPFLSSWQPGFEALLSGVVARCCVHSWRPITSGDRGEVWEGVTFDPSCVRVCTVLEKAIPDQGSETEDGQIETDGEELIQTKGEGEERTGVEEIYKHITSVRSAQRRRRLHRPKGHLTSPTTHHHHSRKKTRQSPRKTPTSIPLWASVVVEEPLDEEACCKVTVTVRSPDQALLISAEAALRASLRVYCSLLAEPRVVPGAGASEVGLAAGLTQNGLTLVGMEQLAVHAFAQALLEPVKALGENGGTPAELAVLRGYKRRWKGKMDGTKGAYRVPAPTLYWPCLSTVPAPTLYWPCLSTVPAPTLYWPCLPTVPAPTPATCPPCPHGDRTHLGRREWMGGWIN
uniref:T-complex protein 1 subunit theta-like 2 n=1 Tax=Oncorhynchus tshawytscha TaxID=74940 RepID=A0AAZ3RXI9_ONCTS